MHFIISSLSSWGFLSITAVITLEHIYLCKEHIWAESSFETNLEFLSCSLWYLLQSEDTLSKTIKLGPL
jgi:hypothetical protein